MNKKSFLVFFNVVIALFLVSGNLVFAHGGDFEEGTNLVPHHNKDQHPLDETTLTLLHDTHLHGNFGDEDGAENIANYFGLINKIKQENPNTLMIANGDDVATSVLSSVFNGEHIIEAFNTGGIDVDTFGNHDFDMGPDQLLTLVEKSEFPWVTANVIDKRTGDTFGQEQGVQPFIIKEVNGVKVGLTGLITEEAPYVTSMGENAQVLDAVEAMKAVIPKMETAGAEIIVVSSHLASSRAREVAAQVDGIDVMVGDHVAVANESLEVINDTLLGFVGDEFEFLGEINLKIENGEVVDYNFARYSLEDEVANGLQPDANVKQVMDNYNSQLDTDLNVVIGQTETELDVMKANQRKEETKIGNFVADVIKDYTDADAALINGGGIRADRIFPVGDLTKRDIMDALPYTNYVVKIEVTGQAIQDALENAVSEVENGAGRFAQVSGINYSFDLDQPVGSRIIEATINGEPIDENKTYTLATVDFIAEGGDGYASFEGSTYLINANSGPLLSNLIIETIEAEGTINPEIEGRIANLTGTDYGNTDETENEGEDGEESPTTGTDDEGSANEQDTNTDTGNELPDTATNTMNIILLGLTLLAAGALLFKVCW
ncbi:5'-nucleotidase C-terminal domain-containing protein [Bacillaceae bacterium S4-13-56]